MYVYSGGEATLINSNVYLNVATVVRSLFERSVTFLPAPRWNVTCAHGWQYGGGLYILGTATLTNTNVYANQAGYVRSPLNVPRHFFHRPDGFPDFTLVVHRVAASMSAMVA